MLPGLWSVLGPAATVPAAGKSRIVRGGPGYGRHLARDGVGVTAGGEW
ncbi:hypothetical protein ACIRPT_20700 [Streptomyces sp. NPDC101227]